MASLTTTEIQTPAPSISENDFTVVLGEAGKFQRAVLFYVMLSTVTMGVNSLMHVAAAPPIDHWCAPPEKYEGLPPEVWKNISIPKEADGAYSKCEVFEEPMNGSANAKRGVVQCSRWQYDEDQYNGTIVEEWNLVCRRAWLPAATEIFYLLGAVVGFVAGGVLSDSIGRKPVACLSSFGTFILGFAIINSRALVTYVFFRCCIAATTSATSLILIVLMIEVIPKRSRGLYIVLAFTGYGAGVFVMTTARSSRLKWRSLQLMLQIPMSLLLTGIGVIQESPRWLISKWELERVETVILSIAKMNGKKRDEAGAAWQDNRRMLEEKEAKYTGMLMVPMLSILLEPQLRCSIMILCYTWFASCFTFHGISMMIRQREAVNTVVTFVSVFLPEVVTYVGIERVGRRPTLASSLFLTSAICLVEGIINTGESDSKAGSINCGVALYCITVSLNVAVLYVAEINPTASRCTASSLPCVFGRLGNMMAVFSTNNEAVTSDDLPMLVYAVVCCIGGMLSCELEETKLARLPEAIKKEDIFQIAPLRVTKRPRPRSAPTLTEAEQSASTRSLPCRISPSLSSPQYHSLRSHSTPTLSRALESSRRVRDINHYHSGL